MNTEKICTQRIAKVLEQLEKHKVDALLILNDEESQRANTRYLTGFSGSSSLSLVSPKTKLLITDSRYAIQARQEVKGPWSIYVLSRGEKKWGLIQSLALKRIGVVDKHVSIKAFRDLHESLMLLEIVPLPDILSPIQEIKDDIDLLYIRQAIAGIEKALRHVIDNCARPGVSELQLERELVLALPLDAVLAFAIIASGPNSALPHYHAIQESDRVVQKGDIIKFDVGCRIADYNSDITRVVAVGPATAEQKRMHRALIEAQAAAMAFYTAGTPVKLADEEARRILKAYGYDEEVIYGHGLGHGLGLRIHENPGVASTQPEEIKFEVGQVVTCEPGIYDPIGKHIKGGGGMRIEDDILITKYGNEALTTFPRDLREI